MGRLGAIGAVCVLVLAFAGYAGADAGPINTFSDPAGDAVGSAPDVTAMTVSTNAAGLATFDISVKMTPGLDSFVSLWIDQDDNLVTGDPNSSGTDFEVEFDNKDATYWTSRWDAATKSWVKATPGPDFRVSYTAADVTFAVNRHDLGDATTAKAYVFTGLSDGNGNLAYTSDGRPQMDSAPDYPGTYTVNLAPLTLTAGQLTSTRPRAGSQFTLSMSATRSDSGNAVSGSGGASVSCSATVGGKSVRTSIAPTVSSGSAPAGACAWKLGKGSHRKVVHATMTLSEDGASVTRTYSGRVP